MVELPGQPINMRVIFLVPRADQYLLGQQQYLNYCSSEFQGIKSKTNAVG
jgi:hypothetical protein